MLVDVYEKTRTIEVPDGDKSVKICKVDLTGVGYSQEAEIHNISDCYGEQGTFAVLESGSVLDKHINDLKRRANFETEQKNNLYSAVYNAHETFYDTFYAVLSNAPIKSRAKEDLLRSFISNFTEVLSAIKRRY